MPEMTARQRAHRITTRWLERCAGEEDGDLCIKIYGDEMRMYLDDLDTMFAAELKAAHFGPDPRDEEIARLREAIADHIQGDCGDTGGLRSALANEPSGKDA